MADEGRNPLELDAVVRRFAESAEALTNVRRQLQVLTELREAEERANESLQDTAAHVAAFTAEAASILKGLEDAQVLVAEVLRSGAELLDGTELKGIAEAVKANSESISGVDGRVDALDSKVTKLTNLMGALQSAMGQHMDGLAEAVKANAESISSVDGRVDALDSKVTESANLVGALQTATGQNMDALNEKIDKVHADVKNPIIVKRLF